MSCDFIGLANTGVQGLKPYEPGKPIEELERELGISDIVKLASNENPLGPSASVRQAIDNAVADLSRYPDASGYGLKQALSSRLSVSPEQIVLGNGSNEVLELVFRTFVTPQHQVVYSQYAFIVYALLTQSCGAKHRAIAAKDYGHDLDAMLAAVNDDTRLMCVANPNNPTGNFIDAATLKAFIAKVPSDVLVVLDEAYYEYLSEEEKADSCAWVNEFPNLIVSRTFSKAYGLAGLRVGYCVCHPQVADLLNRVREPFNNNSLALVAAEAALNDDEYLAQSVELNRTELKRVCDWLDAKGIDYIPSKGNFVTINIQKDAMPTYQALLEQGVIVRPIGGYGMPQHLRVSIGLPAENDRLLESLEKIGFA
ncbi:histidinol-phosphate transaminase [Paraferrimonas sedimenticola]|uniref:Histidinol-phosphate aminotransferase n=1 Tax=Paraferrimonas sedimenticola TaxID=375674 RepID=A0AA37RVT8_9GAMM|nr:histidinol-phosphate transaminase [Paraferrimonas sedimenticola]GLP96620.1 histidinol-phosphate aminotransferase 2 [Paraferrimonas sedimenticola]